MKERLLTFEYETDHIEIHGNEAGLRDLIAKLQHLIDGTKAEHFDHIHLMTPEWGGSELSSEVQGKGSLINQVTVHCWKNA